MFEFLFYQIDLQLIKNICFFIFSESKKFNCLSKQKDKKMEYTIPLLILLSTGASFVQRVCGFGFGIFIMTMLPYILPTYGEATTLSGMLSAAQSIYIIRTHYKYINWKHLVPIMITFLIFSFISIGFVASASESHLKILLGIILILMSLYFLFINRHIHVKPSIKLQISMGTISGVMGGLFGMQGPPAVLYFLTSEKSKDEYLAIAQAYFLIGNIAMTIFRAGHGFLTHEVCIDWVYAFIGVIFGSILGKYVFDKISADTLRKIVYIYMIISGVIAIVS